MKTLANCKPREFLQQTNRIKKAVEKWLTDTDILNIRRNSPKLKAVPDDADEEIRKRILEDNARRTREQVRENLSRILDAILDEHPEETLEVLALVCFVEPKNVDDHTMEEYLTAISEMVSSQAVVGFFTTLARLGQTNTPGALPQ